MEDPLADGWRGEDRLTAPIMLSADSEPLFTGRKKTGDKSR